LSQLGSKTTMNETTGTASAVIAMTPAEEKAADKARLLTSLVNVCGAPHAHWKTHPIVLALKRDGVTSSMWISFT